MRSRAGWVAGVSLMAVGLAGGLAGGLAVGLAPAGCSQSGGSGAAGLGPKGTDPGPSLKLQSGAVEPLVQAPLTLTADASGVLGGHLYLRAVLPEDVGESSLPWDARVEGPRHGLACLGGGRLWVRLVGAEPLAAALTLEIRAPADDSYDQRARPAKVWKLQLGPRVATDAPAEASADLDLRRGFFEALAAHFERTTRGWPPRQDSFASFAAGRANLLAGQAEGRLQPLPSRQARTELGEAMSLYTGMSSVHEALQADRGLLLRSPGREARTLPASSLQGVGLAAHPWEAMLKTLGLQPKLELLAGRVPQDVLYAHFNDVRTFVSLTGEVDELGTPLAQIFENQPGDQGIGARYEEELMVERLGLAEKLGHLAASSLAVVAGDPFLREGTDLAVLFQIRDRTALLAALELYEARARQRHPDLALEQLELAGVPVRLASTPDGSVRQYRAEQAGVLFLSNSRAGLERLLLVGQEKLPSLAQSGDFRYMRALYPASEDPQEGFLFLSDAFVAKAVSPRTKILASRRLAAQADLLALGYAALLHGWLEGKRPASADELLQAGLLTPADLADADGRPLAFDPARGASSSYWGRPHAMRPLADVELENISPEEQQAYERFRETYQSYWRRYIDPVAARLRWVDGGAGLEADVRILPILENSDYDELLERAGKKTVAAPRLRGAVQWTFAVGEQAGLRRELDQLGQMVLPGQGALLGWLGDWVMAGLLDTSGLWDAAVLAEAIPTTAPEQQDQDKTLWKFLPRIPAYAGAHVRNKVALAAVLTALRQKAEQAAPGMVRWDTGASYRGVPIVEISASEDQREGPRSVLQYATVEDVFVITLGRETMEALIDARLDGSLPASGAPAAGASDGQALLAAVSLGPDSWLTRVGLGLLEAGVRSANRQAFRWLETLSRGLVGLPKDGAALRLAALGYLGFEPVCPNGGAFQDTAPGRLSHPVYGTPERPVYPELPLPDTPATRVLRSLAALEMSLAFEGEGDSRGLHARVALHRRPGPR
jgi:hypothetical protein